MIFDPASALGRSDWSCSGTQAGQRERLLSISDSVEVEQELEGKFSFIRTLRTCVLCPKLLVSVELTLIHQRNHLGS